MPGLSMMRAVIRDTFSQQQQVGVEDDKKTTSGTAFSDASTNQPGRSPRIGAASNIWRVEMAALLTGSLAAAAPHPECVKVCRE
jgi:hypothetical protein